MIRVRTLPAASGQPLRGFCGPGAWHLEMSDLGIGRQRHLSLRIHRIRHYPFHVGLTRADPDISDQNVLDEQALCPGSDRHTERAAGRACGQLDLPTPVACGSTGNRRPTEGDRDLRCGLGSTPDRHRNISLQHHAIADQRTEPELCRRCRGHQKRNNPHDNQAMQRSFPHRLAISLYMARSASAKAPSTPDRLPRPGGTM